MKKNRKVAQKSIRITLESEQGEYYLCTYVEGYEGKGSLPVIKKKLLSLEDKDTTDNDELCQDLGWHILEDLIIRNSDFRESYTEPETHLKKPRSDSR